MRIYYSTDNGATWTLDATPSASQTSVDKQMVWVDHSASSPYFNQQYAIWHNGNPCYMNRRTAGAGGTWLAAPIQVSGAESTGQTIGSDVKTNSSGDVFGFWPTTTNRKLFVTKSINGGSSFGTPVQIASTFDSYDIGVPAFNNRRALIYISGGCYRNAVKNLVYASWADLSGESGCTVASNEPGSSVAKTCKTRIWFSRSTDGGTTWKTPYMLNNLPGLNDQFNQWMAVDEKTGAIGIMYYDTKDDAGRKKTSVYYQHSFDDGITWDTAQRVTSATTDETISSADGGNQYGDYNGLSSYAGILFPSWTDRRNAAKEEVWTVKISDPAPTRICQGSNAFFNSGVTAGGTTYQWQVNIGAGYVNIGNTAIYSGATADTLKVNVPPTSWYGYKYRCFINNSSYGPEYTLKFIANWIGTTSVSWTTLSNWGCGVLPDANTDVIIGAGASNYPQLLADASCGSLTIMPGGTVTVKNGIKLTVTRK